MSIGANMPTGKDVVDKALSQMGKPYIFGAEDDGNPNPKAFDCSEFVQWVCQQLGVKPPMVDGTVYQMQHCAKYALTIGVTEAMRTQGSLIFMRAPDTHVIHHVAISDGIGGTVEARGKAYGVVHIPWRHGFTDAAKIPGIDYA